MKLLVFRMSSLGDLILSTSFLESLPIGTQVDWVVASEFAFVLQGHPRIRQLIIFNKKNGLKGWFALIRKLSKEPYDARVDLHVTLRTQLARGLFLFLDLFSGRGAPWFQVSKQRLRFLTHVILKGACPLRLRPTPFWMRFARLVSAIYPQTQAIDAQPPSYLPVLQTRSLNEAEILKRYGLISKRYFAIMPASRWSSKEWDVQKYAELCKQLFDGPLKKGSEGKILILGRTTDFACQELQQLLLHRKVTIASALNEHDFSVTAILLKHAHGYIGGDTGLAHLAEAVGTPAAVIFGPTRPDLGFGPWRKESRSISSDVACAPCSKDGRICYRFFEPYACLKRITPDAVRKELLG